MYDDVGKLAWKMQLDVFGVPSFAEGSAEACPWRWPGQYEDAGTGLFYNRHRYLDGRTGRYIRTTRLGWMGELHHLHTFRIRSARPIHLASPGTA